MPVKNLIIPCVESYYGHKHIANVFWKQQIAKIGSVTLIPSSRSSKKQYNVAYITVSEWCDSEVAYNFIKRISNSNKETRLIYKSDKWWPIYNDNNRQNNHKYTTTFDNNYFKTVKLRSNKRIEERIQKSIKNSDNVTLRPHQIKFSKVTDEDNYSPWKYSFFSSENSWLFEKHYLIFNEDKLEPGEIIEDK